MATTKQNDAGAVKPVEDQLGDRHWKLPPGQKDVDALINAFVLMTPLNRNMLLALANSLVVKGSRRRR